VRVPAPALPFSMAEVQVIADESGRASRSRAVPLAAIGRTFFARAFDPHTCRTTRMRAFTF
jgi:hypothetical protein